MNSHRLRTLVLASGFTLIAMASYAQVPPPEVQSTRLLLPVVLQPGASGAFGAFWQTELWVRNGAPNSVYIFPFYDGCQLPTGCGFLEPTPSGSTFQPQSVTWAGKGAIQGTFLHVEKGFEDQVSVQLRVRDLNDEEQGFGTELPVVSEEEFRTDRNVLLDLPVRPGYRTTLRAYSLDPVIDPSVVVRVYGLSEDWRLPIPNVPLPQLLSEQTHELLISPPGIRKFVPDYLQLEVDQAAFAPWRRVMLEIIPATEGMRIWSFASVTNNITQEITTITPYPRTVRGE